MKLVNLKEFDFGGWYKKEPDISDYVDDLLGPDFEHQDDEDEPSKQIELNIADCLEPVETDDVVDDTTSGEFKLDADEGEQTDAYPELKAASKKERASASTD